MFDRIWTWFFSRRVVGEIVTKMETVRYRRGVLTASFLLPPEIDEKFFKKHRILQTTRLLALSKATRSYEQALAVVRENFKREEEAAHAAFDHGFRALVIEFAQIRPDGEPLTLPSNGAAKALGPIGER